MSSVLSGFWIYSRAFFSVLLIGYEISPWKTKKGIRYYRQEDIEQIRLIYHLVKERGMTLSGARRKLKENRETTVRILEISDRLHGVRAALVSMIEALNKAEKAQKE